MEKDLESLGEIFTETLNTINKNLQQFFKYYRKSLRNDENISEILYTNQIFRNRKKLILLADIIKKTENHMKKKIRENKQNTEMYNIRKEEINQVKNLPQDEEITKEKKEEENNNMNYFRECYCCKINIVKKNMHFFYSNLCQKCGELNYSYRTLSIDLTGRIALVTGGRIKIGFEIAKKLLEFGCKVIITTRFPKDALLKFKEENNYSKWSNNLIIYPIDFRLFKSTLKFVDYLFNNFFTSYK